MHGFRRTEIRKDKKLVFFLEKSTRALFVLVTNFVIDIRSCFEHIKDASLIRKFLWASKIGWIGSVPW